DNSSLDQSRAYIHDFCVRNKIFYLQFDLLSIKESQLSQFPNTPNDIGLVISLSGPGSQFPKDDVIISLIVSGYGNMIQKGLFSLDDPYLKIDGIIFSGNLHGIDTGEHIPIVLIKVELGRAHV